MPKLKEPSASQPSTFVSATKGVSPPQPSPKSLEEIKVSVIETPAAESQSEEKTERITNIRTLTKPQLDRLKALREASPTCALCMEGAPDAVLMECGHGGICTKCARKILRARKCCPMCRENVWLGLRIDRGAREGDFVKVVGSIEN